MITFVTFNAESECPSKREGGPPVRLATRQKHPGVNGRWGLGRDLMLVEWNTQFKGMIGTQSKTFLVEDQEIKAKTKKSLELEKCPREDKRHILEIERS